MSEFTMNNVRKMKNWSAEKLTAYRMACELYADKMSAFENAKHGEPHEGMPNFKSIFKRTLSEVIKNSKRTIETAGTT